MQGFNLEAKQKAERKRFITAVDISGAHPDDESGWTPKWFILGAGIEDSAVEFNPDVETKTDILGITESTINKFEESQAFEPYTLRGGDEFAVMLFDLASHRDYSNMAAFTVLRAYDIVGNEGQYKAHYDKNCTITPQSLGGSATIDMPIEVTFSGDRVHGTVDKLASTMTFTPSTLPVTP